MKKRAVLVNPLEQDTHTEKHLYIERCRGVYNAFRDPDFSDYSRNKHIIDSSQNPGENPAIS